ncbi:hypothetical protein LX15_005216 [Streptoalloteichus tenebrarius]|uniref:Uncharacterized protein n=1 Tax=Streptoalloteichus tenebrarius (strain ATCC 17920 / DSM 40477 / JCM 4838 / CBS 697.72 / NBRC 16177 / NCIMB 11028 / NRRL B-12390 / A12253. 1 / ISP 5477) TaxID=1933 RepID=A0ABT1I156_STRSD|nr:hypothetical protein [Streptoalloteichus tenebrarius]MCP2261490.1 hypothetical protein [Streptoalloteichus tenebrarius]BFE99353.1 hypothetical protein GCM10020241_10290 [Streptoalloteichus tenebrarius]
MEDGARGPSATVAPGAPAVPATAGVALRGAIQQVEVLRRDIDAGRLALDPAAGEQLRTALREQVDLADAWLERARGMARRVPLGRNPVGQAMAEKFERRAEGTDESCVAVLEQYRQVLEDAHNAVADAMRHYREVEQSHVESFTRLA